MYAWVLLIVAGLFESGFAFCLGKMRDAVGAAWWVWGAGFGEGLAPNGVGGLVLHLEIEARKGEERGR